MAPNMEQIARTCFPAAKRVTDRCHVQKLAYEAELEMRVKARWEALDEESIQRLTPRPAERCIMRPFSPMEYKKTVALARVFICFYKKNLYGLSLKGYGPRFYLKNIDIKKGYYMAMRLGSIYHQCKFKDIAFDKACKVV